MMKGNLILTIKNRPIDIKDIREGLSMNCEGKRPLVCIDDFRSRLMRSETSGSEEMNDSLDILLLSNFKKNRYRINYISNRDLLRLYEARSFLRFFSVISLHFFLRIDLFLVRE